MYPTLFRIPFLPDWLADIKSYGVMMMIAFLTGIYLAFRRAVKSKADPDIVLNIGFIALIGGVIGSRAMFVLHYWNDRFANQPSPIAAIFDIRAGGLEFWGGPLVVIPALAIYVRYIKKASVRWYLDITMPSLAWGLAITRIGCFLNGCCWGATCVDQHDPARERASIPWAVRFPYGSPVMVQQYKFGQLTLPKELIYAYGPAESLPVPREFIEAAKKDGGRTVARLKETREAASQAYNRHLKDGTNEAELKPLKARLDAAQRAIEGHRITPAGVVEEQCRKYGMNVDQLARLAAHYQSKPVHPAQLYAVINGFIICWLLTLIFYRRKRHGVVAGWFLILYSISRILLESIRQDNPLDTAGVTISQAISLCTLAAGLLWMWVICTRLPMFSPRAVPFELPPEEEAPVARKVK